MPFYEFTCRDCGVTAQERRGFDAMNDPGPSCTSCGHPTERVFSPTSNLFVPQAFQHTWSDFHDVTERELARTNPDLEPTQRLASRPGGADLKQRQDRADLEAAFADTVKKVDAIYAAKGLPTDG